MDPRGGQNQAVAGSSSRADLLDRQIFGRESTQDLPAPDSIGKLQITIHRAYNLDYGVVDRKCPKCIIRLDEAYHCSPQGAAFGDNPVFNWTTELGHHGGETFLIFEVIAGPGYVAYLPLEPVRRAGEFRKALPLVYKGHLNTVEASNAANRCELLITVRCMLAESVVHRGPGVPSGEEAMKERIDMALHMCAQVRVTVHSATIKLAEHDTEVRAVDLRPYVKISLGGSHVAESPVAFVPHYVQSEEYVYSYPDTGGFCSCLGGLLRGRGDRYEPAPIPVPPGSSALSAYRKQVNDDLVLQYQSVRKVFWYIGQTTLTFSIFDDYILSPDLHLATASVEFAELFRQAYSGQGELPSTGHTGLMRVPLKAIELPIRTADGSQIIGEVEFECEFFQDPIASPSVFAGLWQQVNETETASVEAHQSALGALDTIISSQALPELLQGIRPDILAALADVIVSAAVASIRGTVLHEADTVQLQERTGAVVRQLSSVMQLTRQHMEQLDGEARDGHVAVALRPRAERYLSYCSNVGVNPLRPLVGLVYQLQRADGYSAALRCALQSTTGAIASETKNGIQLFGIMERIVTLSVGHVQEYPSLLPQCLNISRTVETARDMTENEDLAVFEDIQEQKRKGRQQLSSFFPSIECSRLLSPAHLGDVQKIEKNKKGLMVATSAAWGFSAGVAGGMGIKYTADGIHKLDDNVLCNPESHGSNAWACAAMKNTSIDEVCANFLATRKGFVFGFWLYSIWFYYVAYSNLTQRFSRVNELTLESAESYRSNHAVICVSGFLHTLSDIFIPWEVNHHRPWTYGQIHCVRWETTRLLAQAKELTEGKLVTRIVNGVSLLFYGSNPVFLFGELLTQLSNELNYIFDILCRRANEAGKILANTLLTTALTDAARDAAAAASEEDDDDAMPASEDVVRRPRPVTLVGYSFGGNMIVSCLQNLHRIANSVDPRASIAADLVCDVVIVGAPIGLSVESWTNLRRLVNGRFINCFLRSDHELITRQWRGGHHGFAGTHSLHEVPGIENVPMDQFVAKHSHYAKQMPMILDHLFLFRPT